jgi:hypothetical protein
MTHDAVQKRKGTVAGVVHDQNVERITAGGTHVQEIPKSLLLVPYKPKKTKNRQSYKKTTAPYWATVP